MATLPLYEHIKNLFKNTEFVSGDGDFLVGKICEAIEKLDKNLIALLLKDTKTKEHFFVSVEDAFALDQNKLFDFFNSREYFDSSYTSYTNKIGLIRKDSFIKKFNDVVLAWPYKDCVLEGGMSSEDKGKNEVFYNSIISKDEIDRLFEPKVLVNIKKYTKEGESTPEEITMDDNLIIKGNNLLALHSLKKRYAGKIKLIYIDPPYNTGNDGFKYNDRFNHSTWLTFMKNRLEVARGLLKNDGVIFVSIDDNEQAYLKLLMDEVFGRENFVANFVWKKRSGTNDSVNFSSIDHEYVLSYSKSESFKFLGIRKHFSNYKNPNNDPKGAWTSGDLTCNKTAAERPNLYYDITDPATGVTYKCNPNRVWRTIESKMLDLIEQDKIIFPKDTVGTPQYKRHLSEVRSDFKPVSTWIEPEGKSNSDIENEQDIFNITTLKSSLNQQATKEIRDFFDGQKVFDYPKPLNLIRSFLEQATEEQDIILDFHAGSGTTAHAVLDINKEDGGNRKFILVEQMDYIETVTTERVKKVIEKNGEGSFVYAELKTINKFKNEDSIGKLNQNMQYLPIGEIDDKDYGISEAEKKLNKQFYGIA